MSNNIFNLRELAQVMRSERKALGLTQVALAKKAGLRRETIVQLEAGENMSAHTLLQTISALGKFLSINHAGLDYDQLKKPFVKSDRIQKLLINTPQGHSGLLSKEARLPLITKLPIGAVFVQIWQILQHYKLFLSEGICTSRSFRKSSDTAGPFKKK